MECSLEIHTLEKLKVVSTKVGISLTPSYQKDGMDERRRLDNVPHEPSRPQQVDLDRIRTIKSKTMRESLLE